MEAFKVGHYGVEHTEAQEERLRLEVRELMQSMNLWPSSPASTLGPVIHAAVPETASSAKRSRFDTIITCSPGTPGDTLQK